MTTQAALMTTVRTALRDPAPGKVFIDADLRLFISMGLGEIGEFAPRRFSEDIVLVTNTTSYQVQAAVLPDYTPEIKVRRVELWDGTLTPAQRIATLTPASNERESNSDAGWSMWNGVLSLSYHQFTLFDPVVHFLRVQGYAPYVMPAADTDLIGLSPIMEKALVASCRVAGLDQLDMDRDLFTQWQTRTNNSDVSPAALHQSLTIARDEWRRMKARLAVTLDSN